MSLRPTIPNDVPDETAHVARAAFPHGSLLLSLRDELGPIFDDKRFAALFSPLGQPAEAPWRLALVTLLQFAERLSDRQAADAVRSRIDWKYVLALPLVDAGFDASVLCEFRTRLVAGRAEHLLFDAVIEIARARNLVRSGGRQRTDATHVLAAVSSLNRLACVIEAMRHALSALAVAAPAWLAAHAQRHWAERYEPRGLAERQPRAAPERRALAIGVGADGHDLLSAVHSADAPVWLRQVPAVETLRRIWIQQFCHEGGAVGWREAGNVPPAALFISSPYDLDAHFARKGTASWVGYKVHLTESCDADRPRVITHVQTSAAPLADGAVTTSAHEALAAKGLLPAQHLVDTGYVDAGILVETRQRFAVDLIGPVRRDLRWQAKSGSGFSAEAFHVDWGQRQVTCPRGAVSASWTPAVDNRATAVVKVKFSRRDCKTCADRAVCAGPHADRRLMTLRMQGEYEALKTARHRQEAPAFAALYAWRAGVEATISWAVRGFGLRRARYIGRAKVHLQHLAIAAALNMMRLTRWILGLPIAGTRSSPLAHLFHQTSPA
ncbi:IS1182 family transposase [Methylobacterium sp. 17Sr1-1]|uniref:IS1182 family transposase n=1 Tax=Methylobacterium sp. 17Sr1-1 TaxID=2202826 RepID=UPI000D703C8D|nr:IS1182 family transposase [Methylobacterium sp. 17Sr1-1]AWN51494.1 IS1182 family transposase [Methylobacterium sp. 17Sr1-1]